GRDDGRDGDAPAGAHDGEPEHDRRQKEPPRVEAANLRVEVAPHQDRAEVCVDERAERDLGPGGLPPRELEDLVAELRARDEHPESERERRRQEEEEPVVDRADDVGRAGRGRHASAPPGASSARRARSVARNQVSATSSMLSSTQSMSEYPRFSAPCASVQAPSGSSMPTAPPT